MVVETNQLCYGISTITEDVTTTEKGQKKTETHVVGVQKPKHPGTYFILQTVNKFLGSYATSIPLGNEKGAFRYGGKQHGEECRGSCCNMTVSAGEMPRR